MAVAFAKAGHAVAAYDVNVDVRNSVRQGVPTVDEPGLAEEMQSCGLMVMDSVQECVEHSEIAYVMVPTPSLPDGSFTNKYVVQAVAEIGEAIKCLGADRYTVVVCSTVMPGSMDGDIVETLERFSRRSVDETSGISLVYSPQFIALGTVLNDMRNPDLFLVGTNQKAGSDLVTEIGKSVHQRPDVHIAKLTPTEAEIVKIGVNTYITMKISFANALGQVSAAVRDVDGYLVTRTIGHDSRIGGKYITAGGPYGGPCFPRDTDAFAAFVQQATGDESMAALAANTAVINDAVVEAAVEAVYRLAPKTSGVPYVLVLGLGYKPDTSVSEESYGMSVVDMLLDYGCKVFVYDPVVPCPEGCVEVPESALGTTIRHTATVVCSPEKKYADFMYDSVVDIWGIVPNDHANLLVNYSGGNGSHLLHVR
jgi:UDPglucose 6-dehydrogenase